jgi:hypothetical protein
MLGSTPTCTSRTSCGSGLRCYGRDKVKLATCTTSLVVSTPANALIGRSNVQNRKEPRTVRIARPRHSRTAEGVLSRCLDAMRDICDDSWRFNRCDYGKVVSCHVSKEALCVFRSPGAAEAERGTCKNRSPACRGT